MTIVGMRSYFFSSRRRHTSSKRDWSSDVCSSDLVALRAILQRHVGLRPQQPIAILLGDDRRLQHGGEIGRASCRERVRKMGVGGLSKKDRNNAAISKTTAIPVVYDQLRPACHQFR